MAWYLKQMEQLLSSQDIRMLKQIYEPKVVAIPPGDARRSLCVMPDGEIRYYGEVEKKYAADDGVVVYAASRDCGLSWKLYYAEHNDVLGASVRSPYSGKYFTIRSSFKEENKGTYLYSSSIGPSDPAPTVKKLSDTPYWDIFQPIAVSTRPNRWICTMHKKLNSAQPFVMISDDDGENWREVYVNATPLHEPVWPHLDVRWQNTGQEPHVTELPDGRLMLLVRTSLDYLYVYYSEDGGDSWTDGEPSIFHCTLTTPFLLKLSDRRNMLFWCNTQPLPEMNHAKQWPPLDPRTAIGRGEDAFTNRDANHVAISSDGSNWTGFRELFLSSLRNDADYRTKGGGISANDKSVHQFQALELPFGKILVAFGQHEVSRKMVIFDIDWLYETSRSEDFQTGLANVSTHLFVKSISGGVTPGYTGHCSWNRVSGALLAPDPDATYGEALQLCRVRDPRLLSETQGVVWNFPAAKKGELSVEIRVAGSGVRLSLTDHWYNPGDVTTRELSHYSFSLTREILPEDEWCTVRVRYDLTDSAFAQVYLADKLLFKVPLRFEAPYGLCYVHIQSLAESEDPKGTYIRTLNHQQILT
ncbi:sialidase family protein [Paenibacillus cymbidii]|uniref:sialidase family protein n=1 Tax=Paenibacillus cymbidii TaxID=1639034 RepID=UPI0010820CAF|nr:sialidase family protein [Paenibacillus cymbidii]